MRKIMIVCLFVLFLLSNVFAAGTQTSISKYLCTVKKMELYNGSSWVTIFEGEKSMDIASVDLHTKVGEILQGVNLAAGTYTQCRMTLKDTFIVNGTVELSGTTYYTPSGPSSNPASTTGPAQDTTMINPTGDYVQTVSANITIDRDSTKTAKVNMNTANVLSIDHFGDPVNYYFTLVEPSWTIEG